MIRVTQALEIAGRYHRNGDIQQAQVQYQRILQVEPGQPEALHALGIIAFQLKEFDNAGSLIGKAIENKPKVPQSHYNLGLVFISLKRQLKTWTWSSLLTQAWSTWPGPWANRSGLCCHTPRTGGGYWIAKTAPGTRPCGSFANRGVETGVLFLIR